VWVTLLPMIFVCVTTLTACYENIIDNFIPILSNPATFTQALVDIIMTLVIMTCAVVIIVEASRRWYRVLLAPMGSANRRATVADYGTSN
jgi:carbon starvation protein